MDPLDETFAQPTKPRFDTTQWSLVMRTQRLSSPEGQLALSELCQRYWYPLFSYVRSIGHDVHKAQDLTQGFFEKLIEKNYVGDADPARGRFRTFLITSLRNFLANEHDKTIALKRGGGAKHFSLDFEGAENRFRSEPAASESPELRYEQQWARELLDRAVTQLSEKYRDAGKQNIFDNLKQFLTADETEPSAEVAARLDMSATAIRVAIHRLRGEFKSCVRSEIATTVGDLGEVDAEIALLFETFARKRP